MEAPPLERKLVAILAADVASYSRLMEIDEKGTLTTLSAFRLVTDALISRHDGRICGTAGDSILAARWVVRSHQVSKVRRTLCKKATRCSGVE
jgi:class 3 adenylate cyclase